MNNKNFKWIFSSVCLALCFILPFFTGQIPEIGRMLLPMHLPVLLCGIVCGAPFGILVGFIAPLLRSVLLGAPPLFPAAVAMSLELAMYGFASGYLYSKLKKVKYGVFITLLISMIMGRIIWSLAMWVFSISFGINFSFTMIWTVCVATAIPGIVIQFIVIPIIVMALKKASPSYDL